MNSAQAAEIGFDEEFCLSEDRAEALKQLIPGTADYYYYWCLYHQMRGEDDQLVKLLEQWVKRYGHTAQVEEIRNREALLNYSKDPGAAFDHIIRKLNLRFDHQKEQTVSKSTYPSILDEKAFSSDAFIKQALSEYSDFGGFETAGVESMIDQRLNPDQRRDLLKRMTRPHGRNLVQMVADDLQYKHSGGFGSINIHNQMLRNQLEQLVSKMPELFKNSNFVLAYLRKMQPGEDTNWQQNDEIKLALLEKMYQYVRPLEPMFNSLKAHLIYHILDLKRRNGIYDQALFIEYLKLPRPVSYIKQTLLESNEGRNFRVDLNANYSSSTLFGRVGSDEQLVRDYLQALLVDKNDTGIFQSYIETNYLNRVFAETKIVNGIGDMEQWFSLLNAQEVKELKERIELDLLPTNRLVIRPQDQISLDVRVKNVKKLIVKIYKLNLASFYRENMAEVTTAIDLDGLVANEERLLDYPQPEHRRHVEKFTFPELKDNGVYVVELIGNGMSSRALIRRGQLYFAERSGPAGQLFTIFNDDGGQVVDAVIMLAGQEYKPDEQGVINVPYSTSPQNRKFVVKQGDFAALHTFLHQSESYNLTGSFHVDREALIEGKTASLVFRPALTLNGMPIDVGLLKEVALLITSTDREDVVSTREISGFELFNDKESIFEFKVPEKLSHISFSVRGKIENLSQGKKVDLNVERRFSVNAIDRTEKTLSFFVRRSGSTHIVELLGKSGEPCAQIPVNVEIKHRYTRRTLLTTLQTDDSGRVYLGALKDVEYVNLSGAEMNNHQFAPGQDLVTMPEQVCARSGSEIVIPLPEAPDLKIEDICSLYEIRGGTYVEDFTGKVSIKERGLLIKDLPAGDFELYLKQSLTAIQLKIGEGKKVRGYLVSQRRCLPLTRPMALQIVEAKADSSGNKLVIKLANSGRDIRVHVIAARFLPEFMIFDEFAAMQPPLLGITNLTMPESRYLSGRNIGDEYRYILERRYSKIFPGNMLRRPGLLLNPWSLRKTETTTRDALGGAAWSGSPAPSTQAAPSMKGSRRREAAGESMQGFVNLDFLEEPSLLLANLQPDANGLLEIDLNQFGPRHNLQILAVDQYAVAYREISFPEVAAKHRDLRLTRGFNPEKHFSEQKNITGLTADKSLTIEDITTTRIELFDSLPAVYRLFMALNPDAKLTEFSFVNSWPALEEARKLELYSKYSCHELNFFIYKKDRKFFDTVVKPYIANKRDKTFIDKWLLELDLKEYLEPWAFNRLNAFERILLGQRQPDQGASLERHSIDSFDLLPENRERFNHLFKTALKGSALETGAAAGFADAFKDAKKMQNEYDDLSLAEPSLMEMEMEMAMDSAPPMRSAVSKSRAMKPMAPPPPPSAMPMGLAREMKEEASFVDGFEGGSMEEAAGRREKVRQMFRQVDTTEEWVENNYYQLPIEQQLADLIKINAFWRDYASHRGGTAFASKNIAEATGNFAEMMMALAVTDLPFKAEKHQTEFNTGKMSLKAAGNVIVFHEEIKPATAADETASILTGQNFFAYNDRYYYERNERFDKFVTEEFLVRRVYGCQVVITNPTSSIKKVDVLMQVPNGAVPVLQSLYTRSIHLQLEPFSTKTAEYYFYFPHPGKFKHYPVHVSENEKLLASAKPFVFNVVKELTSFDKTSWPWISQNGSDAEVLEFLARDNVERHDLEKIAFRMKKVDFFKKTLELLRSRHAYNHTLWSYGIQHRDLPAIREYLASSPIASQVGSSFVSELLVVNPVDRHTYQHREYWPLVNARVYQLGKKREILNSQFAAQYQALLNDLRYRKELLDYDRLAVVYYLLLQDRIEDAGRHFAKISDKALTGTIQYQYIEAYLAFSNSEPDKAVKIAEQYKDYPVVRWRNFFADILAQASEISGSGPKLTDEEDREQKQRLLAASQPSIELAVDNRTVTLRHRNLEKVTVNFYLMDIELLFSRKPFVQEVSGQFSIIRPNHTLELPLDAKAAQSPIKIPEQYKDRNMLVEVTGGGLSRSAAYYPHSLAISMIEAYGQLQISGLHDGRPVASAYIKVYARHKDGQIHFYKDGYTDLRGKFDYASLSTSQLDNVDKFSILIMTDNSGAVIREAAPPPR
jgi:hypothetical protein